MRIRVLALVTVVAARMNALRLHMLAVKHQHMGFFVVYPDDGVKSGHGVFSVCSVCGFKSGLAVQAARGLRHGKQPRLGHSGAAFQTKPVNTLLQSQQRFINLL